MSFANFFPGGVPISEEDCLSTIDVAISQGVNLFNTATFYGPQGESETILGL